MLLMCRFGRAAPSQVPAPPSEVHHSPSASPLPLIQVQTLKQTVERWFTVLCCSPRRAHVKPHTPTETVFCLFGQFVVKMVCLRFLHWSLQRKQPCESWCRQRMFSISAFLAQRRGLDQNPNPVLGEQRDSKKKKKQRQERGGGCGAGRMSLPPPPLFGKATSLLKPLSTSFSRFTGRFLGSKLKESCVRSCSRGGPSSFLNTENKYTKKKKKGKLGVGRGGG